MEHGIDGSRGSNSRGGGHDGGRAQEGRGRRPDLSTFFSILDLVNTDGEPARPQHNTNAVPLPADVSAAFRTLANSLLAMREYNRGRDPMATSPGAGMHNRAGPTRHC